MVSQNLLKSIALAIAKRVCCWMEALLLAITTAHPKCEPGESQNLPKGIALVIAECVVIGWNSPDPTTLQSLCPVFAKRELGLQPAPVGLYEGQVVSQTCLEQDCGLMQDCVLMQQTSRIAVCFGSFILENPAYFKGLRC